MLDDEYKIYELICCYYIAQFLGDYVYNQRSVVIEVQNELFKATSNTPLELGWKYALSNSEEAEQIPATVSIPLLTPHEEVKIHDEQLHTKQTKPPMHFTEGTLIEAMKNIGKYVTDLELKKVLNENAGIGTEATRANILETLFKRGYLMREGKNLRATAKGQTLISLLPDEVTNPAITALWEQALEAISDGRLTLDNFIEQQTENIEVLLDAIAEKKAQNPELVIKDPIKPTSKLRFTKASSQSFKQKINSNV